MKMCLRHFGLKPLILWSLHLHDVYKLFLGKGCLSRQWICSRFFEYFSLTVHQNEWMVESILLIQLEYPSEFWLCFLLFCQKCPVKTEREGSREFGSGIFPSALALPSLKACISFILERKKMLCHSINQVEQMPFNFMKQKQTGKNNIIQQ